MTDNIAFYLNIISDFLGKEISIKAFEKIFFYVYLRDEKLNGNNYEILQELFTVLEDFVSDEEIRTNEDSTEEELYRVAAKTLHSLELHNKTE